MVVHGEKFLKQKYFGQKELFFSGFFFALKTIRQNNGTFQTEQ